MEKNGDTLIDILKIDVEGWEWTSLEKAVYDFPNGALPVGQLQVEVHPGSVPITNWYAQLRSLFYNLEKSGLRPFSFEINPIYKHMAEFSFLSIKYKLFEITGSTTRSNNIRDWDWNRKTKYYKNQSEMTTL